MARRVNPYADRTVKTTVNCANEWDDCDEEIEVEITRGIPAKTYGRPEDCYEAEPWDIEAPTNCPRCGREITEKDTARWLAEYDDEANDTSGGDRWDD
jgi:hypothetical protein